MEGVAATLLPALDRGGKGGLLAAPIRVGSLDAEDAEDLSRALGARGLVGTPVPSGNRWHIEIRDAHEETARLLAEVRVTLETWLSEHGRSRLTVRVGSDLHTIEAAPTLAESLRRRIAPSGDRNTSPLP